MLTKRTRTTHIVVHSAATRARQVEVDRDWIDRVHRKRGFLTIGYHYVIKRDGTVEVGRAEDEVGAHCRGSNSSSIGICMAGGVAEDGKTPERNFTSDQYAALYALIVGIKERWGNLIVAGHRDMPGQATACPSFDVSDWYETYA